MTDSTLVRRRLRILSAAWVGLLAASSAMAQSSADTASLQWSVPTTLPPSARVAVANGDPTGPGETTFLLSMPNGYRIPPHFHPSDVHLEVQEGTLLIGRGDELDPRQAEPLTGGDSASVPAGMHHFWIASGRTVATMRFIGPFTITYLRAEEAPPAAGLPLRLLKRNDLAESVCLRIPERIIQPNLGKDPAHLGWTRAACVG